MPQTLRKERLFSSREIQKRVRELAQTLSRDYKGRELVLVGVLNGAFIFLADLVKRMTIPVQIDFVRLVQLRQRQREPGPDKSCQADRISPGWEVGADCGRHYRHRLDAGFFVPLLEGAKSGVCPHLHPGG